MMIAKMLIFLVLSLLIKFREMLCSKFLESITAVDKKDATNYWPKIGNLYDYGYVVVWFDSTLTIYAIIFKTDGSNSEPKIVIDDSGVNYRPSVAGFPNGNFIVLFTNQLNLMNIYHLRLHKLDSNGNLIKKVDIPSKIISFHTSCSILNNGNLVIAYTGSYLVEFLILDSDLKPVITTSCVTCNFHRKILAEVATLADGNFIIVLDENRNTESSWDIYAKIFKSDGTAISDAFMVNTIMLGDQFTPGVAPLKNGGFVIIWDSSGENSKVYARLFDCNHYPVTDDFKVSSLEGNYNHFPTVTELTTGGFIISFENKVKGSDEKFVYAREFDSLGNPLSENEFIATTYLLGNQGNPNIKSIQTQKWVIAYVSDDNGNRIRTNRDSEFKIIKCKNFSIKIKKDTTTLIDFSKNVSSFSNNLSKMKIIFKQLPNGGILKNSLDDSEIIVNFPYRDGVIKYVPDIVTPVEFIYSSYEELLGESENCIATLNVCYESCETCTQVGDLINNLCLTCESDYYPLSDNNSQCISANLIVDEYVLDGYIFKRCPSNCKNCKSSTECVECNDNYYLHLTDNNCYSTCPDGYSKNDSDKTCSPCITGCKTCVYPNECLECMDSWYLHYSVDNLCYNICPEGYFKNKNNILNKCESCPDNCKECSDSSICESCNLNYFLKDSQCHATCPLAFFGDKLSRKCENCQSDCIECLDKSTCKTCKENYFLLNHICMSTCPNEFFEDLISKRCLSCPRTCTNQFFFFNDSDCICYKKCPHRYYGNDITKLCESCSINCKKCFNPELCLECEYGYYLHYMGDMNCHLTCPSGYYPDNSTSKCEQCPKYFIEGTSICVDKCPLQHFVDESTRKCIKCPSNCDICLNEMECNLCSPNFFNNGIEECSSIQPEGFYGDPESRKWRPCSPNCKKCSNISACLECALNTFYLSPDFKLCGPCLPGFYGNHTTNSCESCGINCDICENESECKICSSDYFLYEKQCVTSCEKGYYKNVFLSTCSKCSDSCAECYDDSDNCIKCADNAYIFINPIPLHFNSTKCVTTCPRFFSADENRICRSCEELGYFKMNGVCVHKCEDNLFKNLQISECVKCDQVGEFKYEDRCVLECPDDTASNKDKVCVDCYEVCKNKGKCYVEDNILMCKCTEKYTGEFCEIELLNFSEGENLEILNSKTMELMDELKEKINSNPSKINPELINKVTNITLQKVKLVSTGNIKLDPVLFNIFSTAFNLNQLLTYETIFYSPRVAINNLKGNMSQLINSWINTTEINEPLTKVKPEFSVQVTQTNPDLIRQLNQMESKNDISNVEAKECEEILKQTYNIPQNMTLIVKKIDYSYLVNILGQKDNLPGNSDSLVYEYYNPITKRKMNTDVCKNLPVTIREQNARISPRINVNTVKRLTISGLNVLNSNSYLFKRSCVSIRDPVNELDRNLLNEVLSYFENVSSFCAPNCTFSGLDEMFFVNCTCNTIPNGENSLNSTDNSTTYELPLIPTMNSEIFKCFRNVMKYPNIFVNPAFYVCGFFLVFSWGFYLCYRNDPYKLIETDLKEIVDNDARFFDTENMTIEQYFEYNRVRIKKDPDNFKRLRANIENVKRRNKTITQDESELALPQIERSKTPLKVSAIGNNQSELDVKPKATKQRKKKAKCNKDIPQVFEKIRKNFTRSLKWKKKLSRKQESIKIKDPSPIEDIKMYKNRPYKPGVYFRFPDHVPTKKDFECLSPFNAVVLDDRDFKTLVKRFLIEDHPLFNIIYKKSLMNPKWIEVFILCLTYSLLFSLNALFYIDSYIDIRWALFQENNSVRYLYNLRITLMTLLFTLILTTSSNLILIIPGKTFNEFNNALKTKNKLAISIFYEKMKTRYYWFLGITTLINVLSWYYAIAFCGVYVSSSISWLFGSFIGVVIDWFAASIAIPIVRACLRVLIRKYKKLSSLLIFEYMIYLGKNMMG